MAKVERGKITAVFGDVVITSDFDSGNLDRVEECRSTCIGTKEFNLWTAPDCAGQPFESGCRSWFYFSVTTPASFNGTTLRFNIQNLNKQCRLYQQGLTPITKTVPGRGGWERLRERPEYEVSKEGVYVLSFQTTITESRKQTSYFAFCFPYSYSESQKLLSKFDELYKPPEDHSEDSIYYHRELACHSLEGRRIDLVTISSHRGVTEDREQVIQGLFPDTTTERAHVFRGKKVIFVSSRVHPGESPASHVFNGFIQFILRRDDPRAIALRRQFVFKLIPMLNPDGVYRGHYRMNTLGTNLNRMYLEPTMDHHPSIFAARSLITYHHQKGTIGTVADQVQCTASCGQPTRENGSQTELGSNYSSKSMSTDNCSPGPHGSFVYSKSSDPIESRVQSSLSSISSHTAKSEMISLDSPSSVSEDAITVTKNSGIAFYIDLHAHATKRGCFFYGNYFSNVNEQAENMLFPKLVSLNSPHLDFDHCVFSEKNMYTADKRDGLSKEGSGRVAMYKTTGIIHSYTLECNYNSGKQCNALGAATLDDGRATPPNAGSPIPHRFTIQDYEQVGHALAVAALDFYQMNPWSRLPNTDYKSLAGLRESLVQRIRNTRSRRDLLTSAKQAQKQPAATVSVVPPSEAAPTRSTMQMSKMIMLKKQKTLGIAKGSDSIAYDIAFVTEVKRTRKRRVMTRASTSASRVRTRPVGLSSDQTRGQKQPDHIGALSMPSTVKPSVQEVVFPLHTLKTKDNDSGLVSRRPRIGLTKAKSPLDVFVNGSSRRVSQVSVSAPIRARPHLIKDHRRTKTVPLPEINVIRHNVINLASMSEVKAEPCSVIQGCQDNTIVTDPPQEMSSHRRKLLVERNQRDVLKKVYKNEIATPTQSDGTAKEQSLKIS